MRDIDENLWTCVRQRAGPLTKEVRYRRPQIRASDLPSVRSEKNEILRGIRNSCFRRTPRDRLELMFGLMGWNTTAYVLTYPDSSLPEAFTDVRQDWRSFAKALRRIHGGAFDYVYVIEGLHGGKRWHIHCFLRDRDFGLDDVRRCWPGGIVLDPEPLLQNNMDTFYRTAKYLTKERRDGVRIPHSVRTCVAAPSLYRQLQPPERFKAKSSRIFIPKDAPNPWTDSKKRSYGAYFYASYIRTKDK